MIYGVARAAALFSIGIFGADSSAFAQTATRNNTVYFELAKPIDSPKNFNWYFPRSPALRESGPHQAMWEPLFILNYDTGVMEPWLAESLEPDPKDASKLVWILTIRDGVAWSDGRPFSAEDVEFTVNLALNMAINVPAMEAVTLRSQVKSVKRLDKLRVEFTLHAARPRFALDNFGAALFGSFLIMPMHIWRDMLDPKKVPDPSAFRPKPIGTGPYLFDDRDSSPSKMVWTLNSKWWGAVVKNGKPVFKPLPQPARLVWLVVEGEGTSKTLLRNNELDAAREYSLANFQDVQRENPKIIGWDANGGPLAWNDPCARQLDIRAKVDGGFPPTPWSDVRLRKALSLLIDRKTLAREAYGDTAEPSRTMFAQYGAMQEVIADITAARYDLPPVADPVKAAAELVKAGYAKDVADGFYKKGGEILSATITVNVDAVKDGEAVAELVRQIEKFGIKAQARPVSNQEYWGRVVPTGDYEMVFGWLSCGSIAEPVTSMSRYLAKDAAPAGARSPGFNNTGRWDSQAARDYSAKVEQMARLPLDTAALRLLTIEAYRYLDQEMPFIPLIQSPRIIPFNTTYWTGWPSSATGIVPMHSWSATHRIIHALQKVP